MKKVTRQNLNVRAAVVHVVSHVVLKPVFIYSVFPQLQHVVKHADNM